MPFKRHALHDLSPPPHLSVSPTSTDSIILTFTFSLSLSHTHTSHVLRARLWCRQLVSQFVRLAPETGVIHTHTLTQSVDRSGKYLGWFSSECLGMSVECLPVFVSSLSLLFPFLLALQAGVGVKRENDN